MYMVGKVSDEAAALVRVTKECLDLGIRQVRPGGFVGDIGQAIQAHAEGHGYSVVRDFVGHGVGLKFHEDPQIPHFGRRPTRILEDGWTAITRDGSLSAQFEHTVHVTASGVEILTQ
jgi:methionyl aminopeptidase